MILQTGKFTINASPATHSVPLLNKFLTVQPVAGAGELPVSTDTYLIEGSHVLAGAVAINPTSGAIVRMRIRFIFRATLTTDTAALKTFSIFGFQFSNAQALKKATIEAYFNGTTWEVSYYPNFGDSGFISEEDLGDGVVTENKFGDKSIPARAFKDSSIPESAFDDESIPARAFKEQSIPNRAIQDKSIDRSKMPDHTITTDILGLMPPGSIIAGDETPNAWKPTLVQMNDPGPGSVLIAQGYGKKPLPKQVFHQGRITADGLFYINPGAVINENVATYAVTPDKVDDTMVSEVISRDIDFAVPGDYKIKMGFPGLVWGITGYIDSTITGSNGVILVKDDDSTVMSTFTITSGTTIGNSYNNAVGANNAFDKLDTITLSVSGASGGKMHLDFLVVKR